MNETQRKRRGHAFLPPKAVLRRIPKLYETEETHPLNKVIWVHYFTSVSDYWIAELDPETNEAWGYVKYATRPDDAEWGYIDLTELERVNAPGSLTDMNGATVILLPGLVIVERDCHWTPVKFREIKK